MNNATEKHAGMDQYFCEFEEYALLYPDMKVVICYQEEMNPLRLKNIYKHFLNKPYSKINMFVCLETRFLSLVEDKNNALEKNDNETKRRTNLP